MGTNVTAAPLYTYASGIRHSKARVCLCLPSTSTDNLSPNKYFHFRLSSTTMPWTAQTCPFCHNRYANKQGLRHHLLKYTGSWRVPADGVHDVLKIQGLSIMKAYFPGNNKASYQCPSCSKILRGRPKFIEHVFYLQHYNRKSEKGDWDPKLFDPEPYKVWRPRGVFPFLRLPPGKL
jgi:hypothetical protein